MSCLVWSVASSESLPFRMRVGISLHRLIFVMFTTVLHDVSPLGHVMPYFLAGSLHDLHDMTPA